jgi:hypothetical protein
VEGELPPRLGVLFMTKYLLCATVLLFGATALQADVFYFSYAGVGVSATGTLTASALGGGAYKVTDIGGLRNGTAITDTPLTGNLGAFFYGSSPALNAGAIMFGLHGLFGTDTVAFLGGRYTEVIAGLPLSSSGATTLQSFAIRLPEPSTLLLLFAMGLGVLVLAQKLPFKGTSSR